MNRLCCSGLRSLAALLLGVVGSLQVLAQEPSRPEANRRAQAAASALIQLYNKDTGLFSTTGWWNSANAVTALADESRVTGDSSGRWIFPDVMARAPHKFAGFLNDFYDDEGWWALAWIDAYDLAPHAAESKQYLSTAESIFADMAGGWDDTCGGGIWWKKDKHYKNAIANELFLSVAANLAQRTEGKQQASYLNWATREWKWFAQTGMINAENLVNDGLDNACHNNGRTTWSYNQGVLLGGLSVLSRLRADVSVLPAANRVAGAAIAHLADAQGILHDPCEPSCGEDGVQFKGIFTRNLATLQAVSGSKVYTDFLRANADSLWSTARTPENRFNVVWSGPAVEGNAGAQTSALDALVAAAAVSAK